MSWTPDDQGIIPVLGDTCHTKTNLNALEYEKEETSHVSKLAREGVWTADVLYDKVKLAVGKENFKAIWSLIQTWIDAKNDVDELLNDETEI